MYNIDNLLITSLYLLSMYVYLQFSGARIVIMNVFEDVARELFCLVGIL